MRKHLLMIAVLSLISALTATAQKVSAQDKDRIAQDVDQITEVTLERTTCFGTCPSYKVTLLSDGTILYEGQRFVEKMGTYKGRAYGFERLAKFILREHYFDLKDNYSVNATDLPSTITSVVRNGKRKTVNNYGGLGPDELWAIETVIDGILEKARLEKVAEPPPASKHK